MFFKNSNTPKKRADGSKVSGIERRAYPRISKNFILNYFLLDDPAQKHEITQLKNISKGGACIITNSAIQPNIKIGIELKTPFISETTYLSGTILESITKAEGILYETRVQFDSLHPHAEYLIAKLVEFFEHEEK